MSDVPYWLPATLRERGLSVPFTSPALAGARVRRMDRRSDLVLPHPGGARGVYIFALGSLAEFCAATMHDVLLAQRLSAAPSLTPAAVRIAARGLAAQGAAGRAAAAAASAAEQADTRRQTAYLAMLLAGRTQDAEQAAGPDQSGQKAIHKLAARTGRTPEAVMADIELLATRLTESGLDVPAGPQATASPGRNRALLTTISAITTEIRAWATSHASEMKTARQVVAAACAVTEAGRLLLEAAQEAVADPAALLVSWTSSQEALSALIGRPDWLLDGWEQISLLWRATDDDEQRAAALAEMALLLPPTPGEADAWFAGTPALQARLRSRPAAGGLPRAGGRVPSQVVGLTERNERIRALAA